MAVIGYLMYGDSTKDEISTNILMTEGHPEFLSVLVLVLIVVPPGRCFH